MMRSAVSPILVVVVFLATWTEAARAGFTLLDPPVPQRAALASAIVMAKVVEVEEEPILAFPLLKVPGGPKVSYQVARIRIETTLLGASKVEEVRVGVGPGRAMPKLEVGLKGCFFLHKHSEEPFYVLTAGSDFIEHGKAKEYDKDVALARRCSNLLAKTDEGLSSKDAEDRLLTAAMLIFQFRTVRQAYRKAPRTEPIDAGLSQRILAVLAEGPLADEAARKPMGRITLFFRLGPTEADGWKTPARLKDLPAATAKWLADNTATYRIRRYAPEE
jgi:hypothetical protein